MNNLVGVVFKNKNKIYYYDSNDLPLILNEKIIVETDKGLQYATVAMVDFANKNVELNTSLKRVIRKATENDQKELLKNQSNSNDAYNKTKELISKLELPMNLVDVDFTFDRNQLQISFTADVRIDFRELAKKLAQIYKTRIDLRQIGARDKAKSIGGIGPCGRFLCCNTFLTDFESVSINMAKNQSISLNPTKINGSCGRLLCCFKYEDSTYSDLKKELPKIGEIITINDYKGKVIDINIFTKEVTMIVNNNEKVKVQL